jgi:hypothetical protein
MLDEFSPSPRIPGSRTFMPKEWYEEPPAIIAFIVGVLVLIGYIAHESILHASASAAQSNMVKWGPQRI